jgi:hypothetical protein
MKNIKETKNISADNWAIIYTGAPKTHVFYEYQGERAVDPLRLVMDGFTLWREQAEDNTEHRREVLRLWDEAKTLLAKRHETPTHSYVEWLRHQVTMGAMDPTKWQGWKKKRPYPYRGMLISAIYLQEAMALCEEGNVDRVWHIIAMAYYHLGMNTTPSASQIAAKRATKRHKEATEMRRALALVSLEVVRDQQEKKRTIRNIEDAIDAVLDQIYSNPEVLAELEQVDALTPSKNKHDKTLDAIGRFRNLLSKWAYPNDTHPDIAHAFSFFKQKKYTPRTRNTGPDIPVSPIEPDVAHYMRLVNFFEDGHILTCEISRNKETREGESAD